MSRGRFDRAACVRAAVFVILGAVTMINPARADTIRLYAAGSLRAALNDVAKAFEAESGHRVESKFGPSGLLKDEIAGGGGADVFASANMEHPQALAVANKSGPVQRFARNRLCALVRPGLAVDSDTLLERMLDPGVKLGTSTPKADPSGDYAFEVFRRAEAVRPGAQRTLERKALQLTGNAGSVTPPAGRAVYGWHVAEGRVDIFLTYCTAAREALKQNPDQRVVALPDNLAVGADYGLSVVAGASPAAERFVAFILSPQGQGILIEYGFSTGQS